MSKKAWIIFAAVCGVVLIGLVYFSKDSSVDVKSVDQLKIQPAAKKSGNIADHVFGKADSKVTLIEYGDYQCPGCGSAYPNLKEVTEKYKDQLRFVFRNFPLTSLHPNALAASAAAEAAGLQGKFWEMHNKLYETQDNWKDLNATQRTNYYSDLAKSLGINVDTFKKDLSNPNVSQKINFDVAVGKEKAKVTGTPTILLDGKDISSDIWSDQSKLDDTVSAELKANGITLPN